MRVVLVADSKNGNVPRHHFAIAHCSGYSFDVVMSFCQMIEFVGF
jgi:hypothetical protein